MSRVPVTQLVALAAVALLGGVAALGGAAAFGAFDDGGTTTVVETQAVSAAPAVSRSGGLTINEIYRRSASGVVQINTRSQAPTSGTSGQFGEIPQQALEVATSAEGLGISARHVTISTVGLPARIRRLADLGKSYHLAVSLHAPDEELRNAIVPTNDQVGLDAILEAADYFYATTGRQVTYEYVLLRGVNDAPEHAAKLAGLLRGRQAHVNLIPFNDVQGLPYRRPAQERLAAFVDCLRRAGLSVKVRKRKGSEIDAACGQLRRKLEADRRLTSGTEVSPEPPAGLTV